MSRFSPRALASAFSAAAALAVLSHTAIAEPLTPHAGESALLVGVSTRYGTGLTEYNGGIGMRRFLTRTTAVRPSFQFSYGHESARPDHSESYDAYLSGELRRYATESSSSQHSVTAGFESVIEKHPRRGATVCPFYGFGAGVSLRNSRERETDTRVESRRNNSNEFVVSDSSLSTTRNTTTDWTTYGLASGGVELGISRTITFATEYRVLVSYRYRDSSEDRTGSNSYDHRLSEDHRYYRSRVVDVRLGSLQSFVTVRL